MTKSLQSRDRESVKLAIISCYDLLSWRQQKSPIRCVLEQLPNGIVNLYFVFVIINLFDKNEPRAFVVL
jgi:hypothetical protein